ncbi:Uncharacterized protein PECH_005439 [Penicillium ucsense]|uniref:Cysteine-rich transmembrane CYSTM domain-containing protein n=1 Tax=Penicillium ucsense TaxID=2839758 RepID=A0A8J8WJZ6_9EURO|nr:Uncharacterized protein PECM_008025 [Penicillium ucsense]KAF7736338.1 Uncharacterized protein PECH_005439 [Penicillium ucsense]
MFSNNIFGWLSASASKHEEPADAAAGDLTSISVQDQQPTSPAGPSLTEQAVTEQPDSQRNMLKLRGGGAGDVCCGVCAGLLCFECCEDCC